MKKFYTPKNYILNCYSKEEFIKIFEKYLNDEDVLTKFKKKVRRIIRGIKNKDFAYVFEIRQLTGSINGNPFLSTKGLSNYYIFMKDIKESFYDIDHFPCYGYDNEDGNITIALEKLKKNIILDNCLNEDNNNYEIEGVENTQELISVINLILSDIF